MFFIIVLKLYKIPVENEGRLTMPKSIKNPDVEIFENWFDDKIFFISGIPPILIKGLISMKRKSGRKKDLMDVELIYKHLKV